MRGAVICLLMLGAGAWAQEDEPAVATVAKVLPAVVNISAERIVRRTVVDPLDQLFEQFFDQPMNRRTREQKIQSLGSGFLVDAEGRIVTNEHVVERAANLKIQVTFADGSVWPAKYLAGDPQVDLALIKIDAKERGKAFPFIDLQHVSPNLLGQTVLVLGNPLGYNSSVARGILSANDREITIENTTYKHLLQTDAAINPGNSGGPIVDISGRLCGVSSVKLAFTPQGTPTQGLGFAIPARTVAMEVAEFRKAGANGKASAVGLTPNMQRLFGLQLQELTAELANALGVRGGSGAVVGDVEGGSPAAQAGFRPGMIVYKMGAYAIASPARAEALAKELDAGAAVDFVVGMGSSGGRRSLGRGGAQLGTATLVARE